MEAKTFSGNEIHLISKYFKSMPEMLFGSWKLIRETNARNLEENKKNAQDLQKSWNVVWFIKSISQLNFNASNFKISASAAIVYLFLLVFLPLWFLLEVPVPRKDSRKQRFFPSLVEILPKNIRNDSLWSVCFRENGRNPYVFCSSWTVLNVFRQKKRYIMEVTVFDPF